ncbi:MAG: hypothetical protein ACXVQT_10625, partial [Actinomycetota bacterium]
ALPFKGGRGSRWKERVIRRQDRRAGRATTRTASDRGWRESVADAARAWARVNGVAGDKADHQVSRTLTRTSYGEGTASEVTLWKLADAGHTWPGHPGGPVLRLLVGRTSSEVDATSEMWRFFQRHI